MTMSSESATTGRRAYTAGFPGAAVYVGMAITTCTFAILTEIMPIEAFQTWGWRLPFLASIVIVAIASYFRLRVKETAAFETVEGEGTVSRTPLIDTPPLAIKVHPRRHGALRSALGLRGSDVRCILYGRYFGC